MKKNPLILEKVLYDRQKFYILSSLSAFDTWHGQNLLYKLWKVGWVTQSINISFYKIAVFQHWHNKFLLSLTSKNNQIIVFFKFFFYCLQKLSNICPQIKSFRKIFKIFDTIRGIIISTLNLLLQAVLVMRKALNLR